MAMLRSKQIREWQTCLDDFLQRCIPIHIKNFLGLL